MGHSIMALLRGILLGVLVCTTSGRRPVALQEHPKWFDVWKVPAGVPGSRILDAEAQYLRGYRGILSVADDARATGINSAAAAAAAAAAAFEYGPRPRPRWSQRKNPRTPNRNG